MKTTFKDANNHIVSASTIEHEIDFTREQYEEKRSNNSSELVDFDDFLDNIVETMQDNDGIFEDAIFIANDAFLKL